MNARRALAAAASAPLIAAGCSQPSAELARSEPTTTEPNIAPVDVNEPVEDLTTTTEAPTTTAPVQVTITAAPAPPTTVHHSVVLPEPPEQDDDEWWQSQPGYDGSYPDDVWWSLALCEDGGRNRWFPPYSGYFHFLPSTWNGIGYSGYPHEHDYETQREAAEELQARYGWGQWPGCARKLGLL